MRRGKRIIPSNNIIVKHSYRPFVDVYFCFNQLLNDRLTDKHLAQWGEKGDKENIIINIRSGVRLDFASLATYNCSNYAFYSLDPNQTVSKYLYSFNGQRLDSITVWALQTFQEHYQSENSKFKISKEDIFHYVYAVLHNPAYRKKYELNLKREFPRIPFYEIFPQWAAWGKELMELHINYEKAEPYPLEHVLLTPFPVSEAAWATLQKPKLKADKTKGVIYIDSFTELHDVPAEAWEYKLGNRSALEWILDQYKEKKPGDPTIAEKFNTYRFKDYKDQVIDLLKRVCTVSVETVRIVSLMLNTS